MTICFATLGLTSLIKTCGYDGPDYDEVCFPTPACILSTE